MIGTSVMKELKVYLGYLIARNVSKCEVISGPYFPVFSSNTGKYGPEITHSYLDTFHAISHTLKQVIYFPLFPFLVSAHSVHCLQRITLCNELAEFFPNLCKYDIARNNCKDLCRTDATGNSHKI